MAQFSCTTCGHEGHFVEFKAGQHTETVDLGDDVTEDVEVDDLECPSCGSESVVES